MVIFCAVGLKRREIVIVEKWTATQQKKQGDPSFVDIHRSKVGRI